MIREYFYFSYNLLKTGEFYIRLLFIFGFTLLIFKVTGIKHIDVTQIYINTFIFVSIIEYMKYRASIKEDKEE